MIDACLNSSLQSDFLPEEIEELKQIAKEDYGLDLDNAAAKDQAKKGVMLGQLLENLDLFEALKKTDQYGQNG